MKSILIVIAVIAPALTGCALFKDGKADEAAEKPAVEAPKLVGRIASIPADKRFVLIQSYGKWTVEAGTILTTRGNDERSANLRATGESLGQFAAADLQSGTVVVGDAVYSRHVPKPAPKPAESAPQPPPQTTPEPASEPSLVPELPEYQPNAHFENVQKNI